MPIKVQCSCGAAFAAKDELAGKTVKCPKCKEPIRIGAASTPAKSAAPAAGSKQAAANPAGAKSSAAPRPAAKPVKVKPIAAEPAAVLPVTSTESLFDEIGLQAAAAGTRPCPGCTEPMPIEAVVCIKCGYNARIGRRMETAKLGSGEGEAGGHGAVATDLLQKAAQTMEEDAKEDKKKTGEGMPWWVYLIGFAALVGFLGTMLVLGNIREAEKERLKKKEQEGQGQIQGENGFYVAGVGPPAMLVRNVRPGAEVTA